MWWFSWFNAESYEFKQCSSCFCQQYNYGTTCWYMRKDETLLRKTDLISKSKNMKCIFIYKILVKKLSGLVILKLKNVNFIIINLIFLEDLNIKK